MPGISIVIPVLNEAPALERLLPYLTQSQAAGGVAEILVVDGGSSDTSRETAEKLGARVVDAPRGRARQMNAGARDARGEILYFLHADSFPPRGYDAHILEASRGGTVSGCFRLRFDWPHPVLKLFAWFTRFPWPICRGGDQSLFVPAEAFRRLGGYDERFRIYEDNEFIGRLRRETPFRILPQRIDTSARKYREVGLWRLQYHFGVIHLMRFAGATPEALYAYYARRIACRTYS